MFEHVVHVRAYVAKQVVVISNMHVAVCFTHPTHDLENNHYIQHHAHAVTCFLIAPTVHGVGARACAAIGGVMAVVGIH